MNRSTTARLGAYAVLAVTGVMLGLVLGRPELVAVAAPGVILVAIGLLTARKVDVSVDLTVDRDRATEGEEVTVEVVMDSARTIGRMALDIELPGGLRLAEVYDEEPDLPARVAGTTIVLGLWAGEPRRLKLVVGCDRWGAYPDLRLRVTSQDFLGLFTHRGEYRCDLGIKVFPQVHALRELLRPFETQVTVGDVLSRRVGGGVEFAELRPFDPGDDARHINWRASARRRELWVNDRHPDRNSDIVLVVDTMAGGRYHEAQALDHAVRAAASLAQGHLGRRDRVGLVVFGGRLLWLRPGMLDVHRYRILDALADSRLTAAGHRPGTPAVPFRVLPPKAMVVGLSPLLDQRAIDAFVELRGRGFDLAILEVAAEAFLPEPESRSEELARRIWELELDATRRRLMHSGVAVARWDPSEPCLRAVEEVASFRRRLTRVRA